MSYFLAGERIRRRIQTNFDTVVCSANEEGLKKVFLKKHSWWAIRIGPHALPKLKYIAIYQIRPISQITYYGKIAKIEPYDASTPNRYKVTLKGRPAKLATSVGLGKNPHLKPQSPKYTLFKKLQKAKTLDDIFGE